MQEAVLSTIKKLHLEKDATNVDKIDRLLLRLREIENKIEKLKEVESEVKDTIVKLVLQNQYLTKKIIRVDFVKLRKIIIDNINAGNY